jgi:GntR family transcriptional repressor for pyruvate dehydrogenase complex
MSGQAERLEFLSLPLLQRQNLSQRVVLILKHFVLNQGLQAGDRLPAERQLAEALNISRTVLREALSQLIGEGLVERATPRKLQVADFDRAKVSAELAGMREQETSLQSLIELRVFVEIGALEVIVQRLTEAHLAEIEHWVIEGEEHLRRHEPLGLVDARFHAALLHATENTAIEAFLPIIEENLRQSLVTSPRQFGGSGSAEDHRVVAEHRQIFEALQRRDADTARLLMLTHLSHYLHRDWRETRGQKTRIAFAQLDREVRDDRPDRVEPR